MADKASHLGKAGHLAAMAEFLLRGYNVAIPEVDVGDDIFVVDDNEGTLRRVQVKTALDPPGEMAATSGAGERRPLKVQFKLSRKQLERVLASPLTYVFVLRRKGQWTFFVIPQRDLAAIRLRYEVDLPLRSAKQSGRKPSTSGEQLTLWLTLDDGDAYGWGASLEKYRDDWEEWPVLKHGPGATSRAGDRATDRKKKRRQALPAPRG